MAHVGPVLQPYQQEVPLEGGVEQLLGEHVGGAAKGDYLPVQEDGVVEIGGDAGEVVSGDEERLALVSQPLEQVDEVVLGGGVQAAEWLVQEKEGGLLGEGAGHEGAALLGARELADATVRQVGHADGLQRLPGDVAIGGGRAAQRAEASIAAHEDDVEDGDGEAPVHLLGLRCIAEAESIWACTGAEDAYPAAPGLVQAQDEAQEGGLAGAVGSNQAGQTAGLYVEGDALQGGAAVVAGPDVVGFQGQWVAALLSHLKDPGETLSGRSCRALALLCKADLKVCSYRPYHLSLACDDL